MKIEVGKFYEDGDGEIEVIFIGARIVVYRRDGEEFSATAHYFDENLTEVKPKRETIELFWCASRFGRVGLYDKHENFPNFKDIRMEPFHFYDGGTYRIPNQKSLFIYADTFEFVGGE